ncbi:hypothetical protein CLG85_001725 [Yangia mangrovi]|uniref:Uncharacterized protein n=1 Tax=Alloyangia mangrovi TaxID=1779329 RepID=A0ABT2KFK6_9RHOB|nr:hypothetical protein [Alloyangia mangrovi]MCA0947335.1 hypothetical protein [Alloyangia pacifica]MCT4369129.1 hypothetical protein [Alloyangia mangrovi]
MSKWDALITLLVMLPAIWATTHLGISRLSEIKADHLEKDETTREKSQMLRKRAHVLQDMSRLMPNWMLAILALALFLRVIQILGELIS